MGAIAKFIGSRLLGQVEKTAGPASGPQSGQGIAPEGASNHNVGQALAMVRG